MLLSVSVSAVVPSSELCGQAEKGCREDIRPRSWYEIWVGTYSTKAGPSAGLGQSEGRLFVGVFQITSRSQNEDPEALKPITAVASRRRVRCSC